MEIEKIEKVILTGIEAGARPSPDDLVISPIYRAIIYDNNNEKIDAYWYVAMTVTQKIELYPVLMIEYNDTTEYYLIDDLINENDGVEVVFDPDPDEY